MAITLETLASDPAIYLYEFDGGDAVIQQMDRNLFHKSIFLDARIRHGDLPRGRVPLKGLLEKYAGPPLAERPIGWIFHVAQCGSTLLARALDHVGRSLVLREPAALRRLGVMKGADGAGDAAFDRALDVTLSMLGKRWDAGTPVVAKANVPVNFILDDVMRRAPDAPAIALHYPLSTYIAAILRTPGHVEWTERVFGELRLGARYAAPSAAHKAAALWFAQMKAFESAIDAYGNVHSLDAAWFLDHPVETIEAAARLFGVALREGEAAEIAGGELFASYSKNPALDYDPEVRVARDAEAKERLRGEIAEARAWVEKAKEESGLADQLGRPLVGPGTDLLD